MSEYQEFTGRTVEEAIRAAREALGVADLADLDFEILTPGSRGVLGMGAEPARIIAAARSALGGATPKKAAAAAEPLPAPRPPRPCGAAAVSVHAATNSSRRLSVDHSVRLILIASPAPLTFADVAV